MNATGFSVAFVVLLPVFSHSVQATEPAGASTESGASTKLDTNHRIGDRYTYRTMDLYSRQGDQQNTMVVTGVSDGQVKFGKGGRATDLLGNDIQLGNGMQFKGQQIYVAEYNVGKTWVTKYKSTRKDGAEFTVTYEFKVVGKERITVPAGTFDTYRIEGGGYIHQESGYTQRNKACYERNSIYRIWIAPDQVRRYIAQDYIQQGVSVGCGKSRAVRTELISFRPASRASVAGALDNADNAETVE